ncbi:hypothetical protein D8B26_003448 [Coccidioides posadasii str. Silveira]|nr:hypothetical protein D8B26_003448 [Coccidioides posadasii str. Silveira]
MASGRINFKSNYDQASGQMFTEFVVPARMITDASCSKGAAWVHDSPFLPPSTIICPEVGANSLKVCAMRQFLSDQRCLTVDHFNPIPPTLAADLLRFLKQSKLLTLHLWKIFATTHPQELVKEDSAYRFKPLLIQMPMRKYFSLITSDSFCWQTVMSISIDAVDLGELVDISRISNLVYLRITGSRRRRQWPQNTFVNDRVIKTWSEAACAGKAFKYLRGLILDSSCDLTINAFPYLDRFPALSLLVLEGRLRVEGKGLLEAGDRHGWQASTLPHGEFSFEDFKASCTNGEERQKPSIYSKNDLSLPTLHFQIGCSGDSLNEVTMIYHFRREPKITDPKLGSSKKVARLTRTDKFPGISKPRRPLKVKASKGKDISGLLADFG